MAENEDHLVLAAHGLLSGRIIQHIAGHHRYLRMLDLVFFEDPEEVL